jgi:hypothetical protein
MDHNLDQATNMELLLSMFEQQSGLKINFHKTENFVLGKQNNTEYNMHNFFGVNAWSFPFKYLGIHVHSRKFSNNDWKMIEDRMGEKSLAVEKINTCQLVAD